MDIKYHQGYKPENTKWIAVHHTGGLGTNKYASTQHLTAENIDVAHMQRFDMLSTMRRWGGYHLFIEKNGKITQFRALGEESAAVKGWNQGGICISVCLAGNFLKGVDTPTSEQIKSLKELFAVLPKVPPQNIVPHRALQNTTECYGDLPDNWARNLLEPQVPTKDKSGLIRAIIAEIKRLQRELARKLRK